MKKIVLYGTGYAGEKFYYAYKKRYEIVYAIDCQSEKYFHGIPVYNLEEKRNCIKDYFIIVATETKRMYDEISKLLSGLGGVEFENYKWIMFIDRKLAILYGNCHMRILEKYLHKHPEFDRRYVARYYYVADENEEKRYPSDNELAHCELLILQDIRQHNSLKVPEAKIIKEKISPKCINIKIPNLYGCNLFFPQTRGTYDDVFINNLWERHISKNENLLPTKNNQVASANVIGCRDINIESMFREGSEKIKEAIESERTYDPLIITQNFQKQLEILRQREKECDITISDYIEKNYREKQLFYDPYHPTNEIIYEKGKKILKILNMEVDEMAVVEDALDEWEMFIYGSVRRALGLEYKQKYIRCHKNRGTLYNSAIDLQEYIDGYLAWYFID